jgi:hypothetical protein
MPRAKKIDHCIQCNFRIPTSIVAKMEIELHSELIGRVPAGAKSDLITQLLRDWLESRGISC